jgi:hypothetical protein
MLSGDPCPMKSTGIFFIIKPPLAVSPWTQQLLR